MPNAQSKISKLGKSLINEATNLKKGIARNYSNIRGEEKQILQQLNKDVFWNK